MLLLTFQIGGNLYALDCRQVVEIVPMVSLRELPKAPRYLRGVFQYRGRVAPVIDLCALCGFQPAREVLSTRIIMLNLEDTGEAARSLGIVAEQVIETFRVEETGLFEPGIAVEDSPHLGKMVSSGKGLVQCIRPEVLLRTYLKDVLFTRENEETQPS